MKWAVTLVVALVALATASAQTNPCPMGYINFSLDASTPVCLRFATEFKGTWDTMRFVCQSEKADLAKLEGQLHNQVYRYIQQHPDLQDEAFWIGGSDAQHEGYWVWVQDNTAMPMGTPHWYPCNGQPNGGTKMNYACLYTPDFYFHSCCNTYTIYAICQI
ncbi:uncharacterized protein [Panulirus ornatus]|uniref:uncharacterized protein n=1 Tax=Panulirus ornatus TaxID=150431 RepID=UPI003A83D947